MFAGRCDCCLQNAIGDEIAKVMKMVGKKPKKPKKPKKGKQGKEKGKAKKFSGTITLKLDAAPLFEGLYIFLCIL